MPAWGRASWLAGASAPRGLEFVGVTRACGFNEGVGGANASGASEFKVDRGLDGVGNAGRAGEGTRADTPASGEAGEEWQRGVEAGPLDLADLAIGGRSMHSGMPPPTNRAASSFLSHCAGHPLPALAGHTHARLTTLSPARHSSRSPRSSATSRLALGPLSSVLTWGRILGWRLGWGSRGREWVSGEVGGEKSVGWRRRGGDNIAPTLARSGTHT